MTEDCNKPTLTFPNQVYNATQVRLYGLPSQYRISVPGKPSSFAMNDVSFTVENNPPAKKESSSKNAKSDLATANKLLAQLQKASWDNLRETINAVLPIWPCPSPIQLNLTYYIPIRTKVGNVVLATATNLNICGPNPTRLVTSGIIVGYSYEGHCYDLPKPKLMILPAMYDRIPPDDCGYDKKVDAAGNGYAVWIVDKLDECVELDVTQGFVEQLVLEANLPGRRSPTMYAAKVIPPHRSGRLSD
jgi:hypothetical protein